MPSRLRCESFKPRSSCSAREHELRPPRKPLRLKEEAVRALALYYDLGGALEKAERSGRWTFEELEKAARAIAGRVGEWFIAAWDAASYLLVLGAQEARLDGESVEARLPSIEKVVVGARRTVCSGAPSARSA